MISRIPTLLYFIAPVGGGPIKIGCTRCVEQRLQALMLWSPNRLEILATVPGYFRDELFLQWMFREHHLHHEWFSPVPELLKIVEYVRANGTLPDYAVRSHKTPYRDFAYRKPQWNEETRRAHGAKLRKVYAQRRRWKAKHEFIGRAETAA